MTDNAVRIRRTGTRRAGRTAATLAAAVVGMGGLAACSDDPAGPGSGGVTAEELQQVDDRLAELEDRVGALEEEPGTAEEEDPSTAEEEPGTAEEDGVGSRSTTFYDDAASYVGQEVTVRGEVSELVTTTDVGSALRISGGSGDPIAVVSALPSPDLDADDEVRVTGTVAEVRQDTFEDDFGIAADELFADADAWFEEEEGSIAVSASRIEILPAQSQDD